MCSSKKGIGICGVAGHGFKIEVAELRMAGSHNRLAYFYHEAVYKSIKFVEEQGYGSWRSLVLDPQAWRPLVKCNRFLNPKIQEYCLR